MEGRYSILERQHPSRGGSPREAAPLEAAAPLAADPVEAEAAPLKADRPGKRRAARSAHVAMGLAFGYGWKEAWLPPSDWDRLFDKPTFDDEGEPDELLVRIRGDKAHLQLTLTITQILTR